MLDRHAKIDVTDAHGQTPLHYAAKFGYETLVSKFVRLGADPKAKVLEIHCCLGERLNNPQCNFQDHDGRMPLHLAAGAGHLECCKRLVNTEDANINETDSRGMTALHLCSYDG